MTPNGVSSASPPAKDWPPGRVWQVAQLPIADNWAPRAMTVASNARLPAGPTGVSPETGAIKIPAAVTDIAKPTSKLRIFMPR
jgi:hypothetical protein